MTFPQLLNELKTQLYNAGQGLPVPSHIMEIVGWAPTKFLKPVYPYSAITDGPGNYLSSLN